MEVFRRDIDEKNLYKLNLNDIENGTASILTNLIAGKNNLELASHLHISGDDSVCQHTEHLFPY